MGENVKETIRDLEEKSVKKLKQVYRDIAREAEASTVNLVEYSKLTGFYVELLKMTENEMKKALQRDGITWVESVWDEIGVKLNKPDFVYCKNTQATFSDSMDVSKIVSNASSEKMDSFGRYAAVSALTGVALTAASVISETKVIGMISGTFGVALILAGGVLLVKKYQASGGQEREAYGQAGHQEEYQMEEITLEGILEEQRKANEDALKEWFKALKSYSDAVL